MKELYLILICTSFYYLGTSQSELSYRQQIKHYQTEQNNKFRNDQISPLKKEDLNKFDGLCFYKPNENYKVTAQFTRTAKAVPFEMPTTTDRKPVYEKFGELHFTIKGQQLRLNVYQSHDSRRNPLYRTSLFLPFKDMTNTKKTYAGGRFIDLKIPDGDSIVIDFNKAYNPYCAYSEEYSCPIVPQENFLDINIKAGVKKFK